LPVRVDVERVALEPAVDLPGVAPEGRRDLGDGSAVLLEEGDELFP
jgi:hypothetical protein